MRLAKGSRGAYTLHLVSACERFHQLVVGDASGVSVLGLAAQINVTGAEAANDRIVIRGLAGDDVLEASGVASGPSASRSTAAMVMTC